MVAGTERRASEDDLGHSLEIGDGDALAPIGEKSTLLTRCAAYRSSCLADEVQASVTQAAAVFDGHRLDLVPLAEAERVPVLVLLRMSCGSRRARRRCSFLHNVTSRGHARDEVDKDVGARGASVLQYDIWPLRALADERVGTTLGVVAGGAEACRLEHVVEHIVDRVVPGGLTFLVAVAVATQSVVTVSVHMLGLGVTDWASVRVAQTG